MTSENEETQDNESMEFTLEQVVVVVKIKDPKTGNLRLFRLRELDGDSRDKYLNNLSKRVSTSGDGKVSKVTNFDGLQANLLTKCLFEVEGGKLEKTDDGVEVITGGTEKTLSLTELQVWPAKVQSRIFDKAKDISGLDEEAEKKAKND